MDDFEKASKQATDAFQGGKARAEKLTPEQRKEISQKAARARWAKIKRQKGIVSEEDKQAFDRTEKGELTEVSGDFESLSALAVENMNELPVAAYSGSLNLAGASISCFVLTNGMRIIGRTTANEVLTGIERYGDLERTIGVQSLRPFLDYEEVTNQFIAFRSPDSERLKSAAKGMPADVFIDICQAYARALEASYRRTEDADYPEMTDRQKEVAARASVFLAAVAKVGLDALIDEATGYQEFRARDALEVKLRAYLEGEMRKWEKTFPDALWMEFGRLTAWEGSIHKRPKYWGKLVMELIYEYLDPDVAQWLRDHAPKPKGGQNYHQWLSSQYGLQKLVQHIWQVIGMAKGCNDIAELKQKMAENFGNEPVQLRLSFPKSSTQSNK